ncbi:MAG: flagellar protein FlgN [Armatimonadetes bacterium]|nr:flagellar protein FlgN [Armatimonadota bacterium]
MPSQVQLSETLLDCLNDIASLLKQAHLAAVQEEKALVANDPEALVRTCTAQEEILRRIVDRDQTAAETVEQLSELAGIGSEDAKTASLASLAGPIYADLITDELVKIGQLARELQDQHEINRRLLENGLEIVACCLRTLASDPGPNSYSKDGATCQAQPFVISLDRRA